jgi:hypothetical protein
MQTDKAGSGAGAHDGQPDIDPPPPGKRRGVQAAVPAAALALAGALSFACHRPAFHAPAAPAPAAANVAAASSSPSSPAMPGPDEPAPSLKGAFAAAYPHPLVSVADQPGARYRMKPRALYRVSPNTFALVSEGEYQGDAAHVTGGYASIAYVVAAAGLSMQGQPFGISATMGGFGGPPQVTATARIGRLKTLQVETGYFDQGEGDSSAELVELGPTIKDVAVVADEIPMSYTISAGTNYHCTITGRIAPVRQDRVLDVVYAGSYHGSRRYRRTKDGWAPVAPTEDLHKLCP